MISFKKYTDIVGDIAKKLKVSKDKAVNALIKAQEKGINPLKWQQNLSLLTTFAAIVAEYEPVDERMLSTPQKVTQMNNYWKDLDHMASDERKKKNMETRFGIKNIKLDKKGNILSFESVEEAVSKFMTGDVEIKGKRVKVEVEVTGVDNKQRIYHANVLAPKEHFGLELKIPAKVMHRGKWLKTDTGKSFEERDYKHEYKKFQSSEKMRKYRAELVKYNRDKGTYGNGDGKDASHKNGKIVGMEDESTNRGRAEKSRLVGSKRK